MESFDQERLAASLQHLPVWKRVAFSAMVGARMLPNYERFSNETGFGDVSILKRAFDVAWSWVETGNLPSDIAVLREACDQQAPNTEQFSSRYTSAALDAANAASATLDAIVHPNETQPAEVASLARDTVDLFIQELMKLDPNNPEFERAIQRHDLMQRELRRQREDIEALIDSSGDRAKVGCELRAASETQSASLERTG